MDRDGKVTDPLRHHILEAVDCLRQRKCRPDRESIAHYVLRKFGSTMNEIFAELENIVDEGGLIKVEYKGTTSYRSPSNFDTKNSPLLTKHSKILNSSKTTMLIITGINELLAKDPNFAKEGVPLEELKESLVGYDNGRFGEDKLDILLERETNCGSISIAKSTLLKDSLRVFPKDIPVPQDMRIISLTTDNSVPEKEEKKPRKPRKSANAGTAAAGSSGVGVKKGGRGKAKKEPTDTPEPESIDEESNKEENSVHVEEVPVIATKSKPVITDSVDETEETQKEPSPKKSARLSPAKRKLVPQQVAETVRKTYEETPEFETTSAQMIKLASSVVSKQAEETPKPKGPVLVLAGSVNIKSGNIDNESDPKLETQETLPPNCEPMEIDTNETNEVKSDESNSKTASTTISGKKRGRPPASQEKVLGNIKKEKKEEPETKTPESSPPIEGLTRSKRDKRQRKVFDPSDLPNTYTTYSSSKASTARKSRSNPSPSPEEPPPKKAAKQEKAAPRKSLAAKSGSRVDASKETTKAVSNEKPNSNKNSLPLKRSSNDCTSEPEQAPKAPTEVLSADSAEKDAPEKEETKNGDLNNLDKDLATTLNSDKKPTSTKEEGSCEYCEKNAGPDEELLTCASCQASIHPSCMDYPPDLTQRIREFNLGNGVRLIKWQCLYCKTCGVCKKTMMHGSDSTFSSVKIDGSNNDVPFVLCENCDIGFHAKCIQKASGTAYLCGECTESKITLVPGVAVKVEHGVKPIGKKTSTAGKKGRRPVRRQSKVVIKQEVEQPEPDLEDSDISPSDLVDVKFDIAENLKVEMVVAEESQKKDIGSSDSNDTDEEDVDSSKMDITSWTTSDVEAYFTEKGLKEEAAILKDQEVDGYSLLLLQREDIVKGMGFLLGPALKVYRAICDLQSKAPVRAKWNGQVTSESENGDSTNLKPSI